MNQAYRTIARYFFLFLLAGTSFTFQSKAQSAPDFSLTDVNGTTHHLYTELEAGKTVVLDFFGLTCGSCQTDIGYLENIWLSHEGAVSIWALESLGFTPEETEQFVSEYGGSYPRFALEGDNTLLDLYQVTFIPRYFVICPNGSIKPSIVENIENHVEACSSLLSQSELIEPEEENFYWQVNQQELRVHFREPQQGPSHLYLYNSLGKIVSAEETIPSNSFETINLPLNNLPSGVYFLQYLSPKHGSSGQSIFLP